MSSRAQSIFDEPDADKIQPYEDALDQLDFPESPSPDDDNYEPDNDNNEDDEDDVPDHEVSPTPPSGRKRPRANSIDADNTDRYERARKVVKSVGRPRASDYAEEVQDVLNTAITYYKVDLLHFDPYPNRADELAWAKTSWSAANTECGIKIAHNAELVKMVSCFATQCKLYSHSV
jgi:hypothetical protein